MSTVHAGRFTITTSESYDSELHDYVDLIILKLSQKNCEVIMNDYKHLLDKIIQYESILISFTEPVLKYLDLFESTDDLKTFVMKHYVSEYIGTQDWLNKFPLIIQYVYLKYNSSLLILKPSENLKITLNDLKTALNATIQVSS